MKKYTVSVADAAVLMYHLTRGADIPEVGFVDAEFRLPELRSALERQVIDVPKEILESCLWSANLMGEIGLFWHPDKKDFKTFVSKLLPPGESFDAYYNLIEEKKK